MDDLIILTGLDTQAEWHLPKKLKRCPVPNCSIKADRRTLVLHYRKFHFNAIVCTICEKPVSATSPHNVIHHYERKHPAEEIPAYILEKAPKKKIELSKTDERDKSFLNDETDVSAEISSIY